MMWEALAFGAQETSLCICGRSCCSASQMMLHLTEFHRSAGTSSPFRLAVDGKKTAPINRSFGIFVSPLQQLGQIEHGVCVVRRCL